MTTLILFACLLLIATIGIGVGYLLGLYHGEDRGYSQGYDKALLDARIRELTTNEYY